MKLPPAPDRIDRLYAWCLTRDGQEQVIAVRDSERLIPLIAASREAADGLQAIADDAAQKNGAQASLVLFHREFDLLHRVD